MKEEGFIREYRILESGPQGTLALDLKYGPNRESVITGIKRISKPGLRRYAKAKEVPTVLNGLGISIISTSKGIITDKAARNLNTGGEILCEVW